MNSNYEKQKPGQNMLPPHQQTEQKNAAAVEVPTVVVVAAASNVSDAAANQTVEHARQHCVESVVCNASLNEEVSIIDNMASFLEAHGGTQLDQKVLRCMAEALTHHVNDTSPRTLQDVTMENSYSVGYRSPCVTSQQFQGHISPQTSQGRSVREFEEQMSSLRKENFNLKLRLYFMEENIPGFQTANTPSGHDSLLKQLIDLKVDSELLRKELHEKQDLLKDAAMAFNQMEDVQKETEKKHQNIVDELNQRIKYLEIDKSHNCEFINSSDIAGTVNALLKTHEHEGHVQSEFRIAALKDQIAKLDELLLKRDETIKECEEKVAELVVKNAELIEVLETKESDIQKYERKHHRLSHMNSNLKEDNINLISALKVTQDNFRKESGKMKTCERKVHELQVAMGKMESTLTRKSGNMKQLLDRVEEYEKMVTKINFERNVAKRENRFFRSIISKLQHRRSDCVTIEKAEIFQHISTTATTTTAATGIEHACDQSSVSCGTDDDIGLIEDKIISHKRITPTVLQQNEAHTATYHRNEHQKQNHLEHHRQRPSPNVPNVQQPSLQHDHNTKDDHGHSHDKCCRQPHDHYDIPDLKQPLAHHQHQRPHRHHHSDAHERNIFGDQFDGCDLRPFHYDEVRERGDYQGGDFTYQLPRNSLSVNLKQSVNYHHKNSNLMTSPSSSLTPAVAMAVACGTSGQPLGGSSDLSLASEPLLEKVIRNTCPCGFRGHFDDSIPIRYTLGKDSPTYSSGFSGNGRSESCSSLHPNYSSTSFADANAIRSEIFLLKKLSEELHEQKTQLADKLCMLQDAEEELKNRNQIHEQACRTIQKLMQNVKQQQGEMQRLKEQNATLGSNLSAATNNKERTNGSEFECSGMCRSVGDSEENNDPAVRQMQKLIEEQENTIKELRAEVKKKTANLQNLVNKELWEKNREIERLTKLVNNKPETCATPPSAMSPTAAPSTEGLQKSFSDVDYAKAVERNKLLQRKVDILIQRLSAERNSEALMHQLRNEVREAHSDAESAEKWRRECAEVCTVLTNRLEELAGFLHTLLKHKDVLGVLAADRRRAIRKAVDRSLDLSKSLNMQLSISGVSMCDQSFAQLSNLSLMLGDAEHDVSVMAEAEDGNGEGSLKTTFNSHEAQSIESLRAENKALKKELEKRHSADAKKERRSLPLQAPPPPPSVEHNNHSESEAWSEPDRKVSMARIGLDEHSASLTKETAASRRTGGATDSESDAQKQIRSAKPAPQRMQDRLSQLEMMITHRDQRILEGQCQLVDADNRLKRENLLVLEMTQELEHLRIRNEELQADLIAIGSNDAAFNSGEQQRLLRQLEEKAVALEWAQEECGRITSVAAIAEVQINALQADLDRLQQQHQRAEALAGEQEKQRLQELRCEMEALLQQRLSEREHEYQEALSRDWIARSVYEECKQQLLELQRQYAEQQRNVDYMQETEQELKQLLLDNEHAERALKKQLDESTLQASRAVMERTKALSEKLQLEKRMQQLGSQLAAHESERRALQQHVLQLEQQMAEAATARLNGSDMSQSGGYTSEEMAAQDGNQKSADALTAATTNAIRITATAAAVGAQRLHNSSPDLGIESDAGRASSAELANVQRPLHKTVVLATDGIKDEINGNMKAEPESSEGNQSQAVMHDCVKVEQDCAELRRKLTRLKRAFEDTCEKLRVSNQRKAQVEKDIKNQILKTHNVLKNVRANMENEQL